VTRNFRRDGWIRTGGLLLPKVSAKWRALGRALSKQMVAQSNRQSPIETFGKTHKR